jgi:signal transduction histidine kinase
MRAIRALRGAAAWEFLALGAILAVYIAANAVILAERPAMQRAAETSVDSALAHDRSRLDQDLVQWRARMFDDGRWVATLAGVLLDAHPSSADREPSAAELTRLRELTRAQMPSARVWIINRRGRTTDSMPSDRPTARHARLARLSLERDTTVFAASELHGHDLRLAVASPVRGRDDLAVVLDLSAAERLGQLMPNLTWEGHAGLAALTFPLDTGFVGTTWTGDSRDPKVDRLKIGWSLADPSLISVSGELPDTTPRFELGIPRAAAIAQAEARAAWLHAIAAIVAFPCCVAVLLAGRAARNTRLRTAEVSLAESQLRTAQAEIAAAHASLAAIQARLNPHFLANALHSVSALIATDPEAAEDALDRLGDLFRYSLEQSERPIVALESEWRFVLDYVAIEQMRLGRRLAVEMELDPATAGIEVPSFALQPLVENAIRHGIGPRRGGGIVRVSARRLGDRLELRVADDGVGVDPAAVAASPGTGLRTLQQRLALDAAFEGRVEIDTAPGAGFRVRVTLTIDRHAAFPPNGLSSESHGSSGW